MQNIPFHFGNLAFWHFPRIFSSETQDTKDTFSTFLVQEFLCKIIAQTHPYKKKKKNKKRLILESYANARLRLEFAYNCLKFYQPSSYLDEAL